MRFDEFKGAFSHADPDTEVMIPNPDGLGYVPLYSARLEPMFFTDMQETRKVLILDAKDAETET